MWSQVMGFVPADEESTIYRMCLSRLVKGERVCVAPRQLGEAYVTAGMARVCEYVWPAWCKWSVDDPYYQGSHNVRVYGTKDRMGVLRRRFNNSVCGLHICKRVVEPNCHVHLWYARGHTWPYQLPGV